MGNERRVPSADLGAAVRGPRARRDRPLREQVLFWLVQSHSDERFAYVETLTTGR